MMSLTDHGKGFLSLIAALVIYALAYSSFMMRDCPVFVDGKVRFYSAFRWARPAKPPGELDMGTRAPSVFNYVFWPADFAYYSSSVLLSEAVRIHIEAR